MKVNKKHTRIFGTIFLASLLVMLVGNIDNTSAIYNWVEYEGFVKDDNGKGISSARVYLKDTDTGATVDYDNTNGTGYYYIKEYVDATERFDLKAIVINTSGTGQNTSWTDYTYEDVLGRAEAEPWWYDFDLSYVSKYAIIVGLNNYSVSGTWRNLEFCENDADDWNSHLTNSSGVSFDNVKQYEDSTSDHDGRATEANIKSALASVNSSANAGDIIAFIFSGHGWDHDGTTQYSLCMWDADNGQNGEDGFLNHTELTDIFENCLADRVFFFFDSCHSKGMATNLSNSDIANKVFLAAAAGSDEIAYEDDAHYNGCWTYCFLEYAWFTYYDYGIITSFDDIFSEAHDEYRSIALEQEPPDHYNPATSPEKYNGFGGSFDLDNYNS